MTNVFAAYATNTAFLISLSKTQVKLLNSLILPPEALTQLDLLFAGRDVVVQSLCRKGLVEFRDNELVLTQPGKLVIKLLGEAELLTLNSKKELMPMSLVNEIMDSFA